jgi:hypothetical protein
MTYPTAEEFRKQLLGTTALPTLVSRYVLAGEAFGGMPYVFRSDPSANDLLKEQLCSRLSLRPEAIFVVGSAKVGFSISPDNFPRAFSPPASDIDVVVIDARLFDVVWNSLLEWHYPRRWKLVGPDWNWARRRQDDLYWGWFSPHHLNFRHFLTFPEALKPVRNLKADWLAAFRELALHPLLSRHEVTGRLYRTWDHVLSYHVDSLRKLRNVLVGAP